jgi:hypothetical protein
MEHRHFFRKEEEIYVIDDALKESFIIPKQLLKELYIPYVHFQYEFLPTQGLPFNYKLTSINSAHRKNLARAGFFTSEKGITINESVINYLDSFYTKYKDELNLGIKYKEYNSGEFTRDTNPNRTLKDILTNGYKGNRLDIMVGNYVIFLEIPALYVNKNGEIKASNKYANNGRGLALCIKQKGYDITVSLTTDVVDALNIALSYEYKEPIQIEYFGNITNDISYKVYKEL